MKLFATPSVELNSENNPFLRLRNRHSTRFLYTGDSLYSPSSPPLPAKRVQRVYRPPPPPHQTYGLFNYLSDINFSVVFKYF